MKNTISKNRYQRNLRKRTIKTLIEKISDGTIGKIPVKIYNKLNSEQQAQYNNLMTKKYGGFDMGGDLDLF